MGKDIDGSVGSGPSSISLGNSEDEKPKADKLSVKTKGHRSVKKNESLRKTFRRFHKLHKSPEIILKDVRITEAEYNNGWKTSIEHMKAEQLFPDNYYPEVVLPCLKELMHILHNTKASDINSTCFEIEKNAQKIRGFVIKNAEALKMDKDIIPSNELPSTLTFARIRLQALATNEAADNKVEFNLAKEEIARNCFAKILEPCKEFAKMALKKMKADVSSTVADKAAGTTTALGKNKNDKAKRSEKYNKAKNTFTTIEKNLEQIRSNYCHRGRNAPKEKADWAEVAELFRLLDDMLKQD